MRKLVYIWRTHHWLCNSGLVISFLCCNTPVNGGGGEYMNNQKYAHTLLMGISIFCTHENTVIQYMNTVKQPVMKEPRLTESGLSSKMINDLA